MLAFNKSHGLGNDFVIIDDRNDVISDYMLLSRKLCYRNTGVGADTVLIIKNSDICDLKMLVYNSDGSSAGMCGNGIRCFARYAYEHGLVSSPDLTVETLSGIIKPHINFTNGVISSVTIDMGVPRLEREYIPMLGCGTFIDQHIKVANYDFLVTSLQMTVPHSVVFVDNVRTFDVKRYGQSLEQHPFYPEGTNVDFVEVIDRGTMIVRPWERGCGTTLACGTGACASTVAGFITGRINRTCEVRLELGSLYIEYATSGNVIMTGPAISVFNGELDLDAI